MQNQCTHIFLSGKRKGVRCSNSITHKKLWYEVKEGECQEKKKCQKCITNSKARYMKIGKNEMKFIMSNDKSSNVKNINISINSKQCINYHSPNSNVYGTPGQCKKDKFGIFNYCEEHCFSKAF